MLNEVRKWLNSSRDYTAGARIYAQAGNNPLLRSLFLKPRTDFSYKLLQDELLQIYHSLKALADGQPAEISEPASTSAETDPESEQPKKGHGSGKADSSSDGSKVPDRRGPNPELYEAAHSEAIKPYKEAMNDRAVLFRMIPSTACEDPNRPDLIEQRRELGLNVVKKYNEASALFDRADYVRIHGKLPDNEQPEEKLADPDQVHECLVYYYLTAYQKNLNKMKARAGKVSDTPERVAMMQQYESHISKLTTRWHSLKSIHLQ
jgi:hypothetical protein